MFKNKKINDVKIKELDKFSDKRGYLQEIFRSDEFEDYLFPKMSYVSKTYKDVLRGPHEHRTQCDHFLCVQGKFEFFLWDNREESDTFYHKMNFIVDENNLKLITVPSGVVHAYKAIDEGLMFNFPNQLYAGNNKEEEVDEIRHEDEKSIFYQDAIVNKDE